MRSRKGRREDVLGSFDGVVSGPGGGEVSRPRGLRRGILDSLDVGVSCGIERVCCVESGCRE